MKQKNKILYNLSFSFLNVTISFILKKSLVYFLKKIYGLANYKLNFLFKKTGLSINLKINNIPTKKLIFLISFLDKEGKLYNSFKIDEIKKIEYLKIIKNCKFFKFQRGLPLNGQRTRTNAKTSRYLKKK